MAPRTMFLATDDIEREATMGRYRRLSIEERGEIVCMRGAPLAVIARAIGRDKSAVSRELGSNSFGFGPVALLVFLHGAPAALRLRRQEPFQATVGCTQMAMRGNRLGRPDKPR